ncbi:hypothetical protein M9Y10_023726 [Tritrichomonas musculus]|uniref:DUF3447 domain-containing protein n=1 Tax=Tritrichomonas musculus TaxID=1915356 RepID=A0ABR2KWV6_9EUKA
MNNIAFNDEKIKLLAQIQKSLCDLEPNATDESIDEIISKIPTIYFTEKDNLMIICELFAIYTRNKFKSTKNNSIRLFGKIMEPIKAYLKNESSFFWNIFGGIYSFKLWMFQEGLISIETIIQSVKKDQTSSIIDFFFPEIIERHPEIFEKELKYKMKKKISEDDIINFKKIRKKYFQWIKKSGDYNDLSYKEIETNELRLSIKRDDIELFQKLFSNLKLSTNSKIKESLIENFLYFPKDMTLLEYAIEYDAIKIVKFLMSKNNIITDGEIYCAISSNDHEMVKTIESKNKEIFSKLSLSNSISNWNNEVTRYTLNKNKKYDYIQQRDAQINDFDDLMNIFSNTFFYCNFMFFESTLVPFMKNNQYFIDQNINEILFTTFSEHSCFFTKIFFMHPNVDINYYSKNKHHTFLGKAICEENLKAVKLLLNHPDIDPNKLANNIFTPLILGCGSYCCIEIIKQICRHPKFNINLRDKRYHLRAYEISLLRGNIYASQFLFDNFPDFICDSEISIIYNSIQQHYLMTLKIFLAYYKNIKYTEIINSIRVNYSRSKSYNEEIIEEFKQMYSEIMKSKIECVKYI